MLNQENSSCQFADELVSYLYGEIETEEKLKFETHLNDCFDCQSEFENFQFTRAAILDWRDAEFSNLSLPTFEISAIANLSAANLTDSGSWFANLRKLFSFNPAYAMVALAIAVVGIEIALYALNLNKNNETADLQIEKVIEKPVVSPTVEISKTPPESFVSDKNSEKKSPPVLVTNDSTTEPKRGQQSVPTKAVLKVPANISKKNADNQPLVSKEPLDKKSLPVKNRQVPNLNRIEDEEDKSIRLADLFAELDTK